MSTSYRTTKVSFNKKVKLNFYERYHEDDFQVLWYSGEEFGEIRRDRSENAAFIKGLGEETAERFHSVTRIGSEIQIHPQMRRLREFRRKGVRSLVIDEQSRQEKMGENNPDEIAFLCKHITQSSAKDARVNAIKVLEEVNKIYDKTNDELPPISATKRQSPRTSQMTFRRYIKKRFNRQSKSEIHTMLVQAL